LVLKENKVSLQKLKKERITCGLFRVDVSRKDFNAVRYKNK
jgi:hypothetical protein